MSDSYTPSNLVKDCHKIVHLNERLQVESNNFGMFYNNYWNSYTRSLTTLPAIIAALGYLGIIILIMSLLCRICFKCCRCVNTETVKTREGEVKTQMANVSIKTLTILFYTCAAFTIFSDVILFVGNDYLTKGVSTATHALSFLSTTFDTLNNDGNNLQAIAQNLDSYAQLASPCPMGQVTPAISEFQSDVSDYQSFIDPIPNYVDSSDDKLKEWGTTQKNNSIWGLFALTLLIVVNYQVGLCLKSKLFLQLNLGFAVLCLMAFIAFCAAEMVLVMLLSDFCMSPTSNTLQLLDAGSPTYDMVSYYATCVGTDPLSSPLSSAFTAVQEMQQALATAETVCPGNTYVQQMADQIPVIYSTLYSIGNTTACPPLQSQVTDVLNSGLCQDSFTGLFVIWVSEFFTVMFLFCVTVVASIMYQFFGRFWDITAQQKRDEVILGVTTYSYFDAAQANTNYTSGSTIANTGTSSIQQPLMVSTPKYNPPSSNMPPNADVPYGSQDRV